MPKHHFFAALLKGGYPTGEELHASAEPNGHTGLTADEREQIAAQVRDIASRAAEEYRQRGETIPPYVLSAMNCCAEPVAPALKAEQPVPEKRDFFGFRTLGATFPRGLVQTCLLVLIPISFLGLHRQRKEQANHFDQQLQTLKQQNGALLQQNGVLLQQVQEIKSLRSDSVPTEELDSRLQSLNLEVARGRDEIREMKNVVLKLHPVQVNCTPQSSMAKNGRIAAELTSNVRHSGTCSDQSEVHHDSGRPISPNFIEEPTRPPGQRMDPAIAAVYEEPLVPASLNPSGYTQLGVSNNRAGSRVGGVFTGVVGFVKGLPGYVTGRHSPK